MYKGKVFSMLLAEYKRALYNLEYEFSCDEDWEIEARVEGKIKEFVKAYNEAL